MSADHGNIKRPSLLVNLKTRIRTLLSKRAARLAVAGCLVIIVVLLVIVGLTKYHQHKAATLYAGATTLAVQGNYTSAADKLIAAYNSENRPNVKANYAYNIGLDYFNVDNVTNGKKWMATAADLYKQIGDITTATQVQQLSAQMEDAHSPAKLKQADQNAKSRGNVEDSNL